MVKILVEARFAATTDLETLDVDLNQGWKSHQERKTWSQL